MPRGSELPELARVINDEDSAIGVRLDGNQWPTYLLPAAAATGPVGPRGPRSDPGADGAPGSDGPQGPDGAKGIDGLPGDQGAPGSQGAPGANGTNGLDGRNGPELTFFDTFVYDDFEQQAEGSSLGNGGVGWLPGNSWVRDAAISGVDIVSEATDWGVNQRRVELGYNPVSSTGCEFGRRMPWGSDWSTIDIIVHWRVDGTASIAAPNAGFALGVCSGTAPMFIGNTPNWIGITNWSVGPPHFGSTTYSAGTQNYFHQLSTPSFWYKRGAVGSYLSSGTGSAQWYAAGPASNLSFLRLEILRPPNGVSGTYTMTAYGGGSATNVEYFRANKKMLWDFAWDEYRADWASPTSVSHAFVFDESTGALDTFNFFWSSKTNICQVGGVAIFKG